MLRSPLRRLASALRTTGRAIFLTSDSTLDVQQLFFFGGIALLSMGAAAIYAPAGYLTPGAILLWQFMPTRPPFVVRPPVVRKDK